MTSLTFKEPLIRSLAQSHMRSISFIWDQYRDTAGPDRILPFQLIFAQRQEAGGNSICILGAQTWHWYWSSHLNLQIFSKTCISHIVIVPDCITVTLRHLISNVEFSDFQSLCNFLLLCKIWEFMTFYSLIRWDVKYSITADLLSLQALHTPHDQTKLNWPSISTMWRPTCLTLRPWGTSWPNMMKKTRGTRWSLRNVEVGFTDFSLAFPTSVCRVPELNSCLQKCDNRAPAMMTQLRHFTQSSWCYMEWNESILCCGQTFASLQYCKHHGWALIWTW